VSTTSPSPRYACTRAPGGDELRARVRAAIFLLQALPRHESYTMRQPIVDWRTGAVNAAGQRLPSPQLPEPSVARRLVDDLPARYVVDDLEFVDIIRRYAYSLVSSFRGPWKSDHTSPTGGTVTDRRTGR
jgi:hypothetical protein